MTSLDPSHAPFLGRSSDRKHGEAVVTSLPARRGASTRPQDLLDDSDDSSIDEDTRGGRKKQQEQSARARGRVPIPPLPDLRYEQGYLLSIMPFLHPLVPPAEPKSEKGKKREDEVEVVEETSLVKDARQEVFRRPMTIEWPVLLYVTGRDQIVFPLLQGLFWGTIGVGATGFMLWRQVQPKASRSASLLHANVVGWIAALLGAEAIQ